MKKDILRTLKAALKKEVYVLPMFTDEFNGLQLSFYINWTSADRIINDISQISECNDIIFVDPDTGIKDDNRQKYVKFVELGEISKKFGLVVVYDQSMSRGSERSNANNKIRTFRKSNLHCFYLIAQACFAFISRDENLLEKAMICLLEEQVIYPERLVETRIDILKTLKKGLNKENKIYVLLISNNINDEQMVFYKHLTCADKIIVKFEDGKRKEFQNPPEGFGIIFIDPDIGINDNAKSGYVSFDELGEISKKFGLVVVYDKSFSSEFNDRVKKEIRGKIDTFSNENLYCFYFYLNAQACFAFISRDKALLEKAMICLLEEQVIYPERLVETRKDILKTLIAGLNKKIYAIVFNEEQEAFYKHITSADDIKTEKFEHGKRKEYFQKLSPEGFGIIFIDPDTGIKDDNGQEYVSFDELGEISKKFGLVVVYDKSFSSEFNDRVEEIKGKIGTFSNANLYCFYFYLNAQACFAFISRDENLLKEAKKCLEQVIPQKGLLIERK